MSSHEFSIFFSFLLYVEITCPPLEPPPNGAVDVLALVFESVVTYTCDTGFQLSSGGDSFNRVCLENGEWSADLPVCEGEFQSHVHGLEGFFKPHFLLQR